MKDRYVELASRAVENWLKHHREISVPSGYPQEMLIQKAGVFVSLHLKDGSLRGCIGTYTPSRNNLAQEIIHNAIAAATKDPRFPPVTAEELPQIQFSVDVLSEPKSVPNNFPLNPKIYGLIVATADGRRGLLLPDIEGIKTPEEQIKICKMKAGIFEDEPVSFQVFTVVRHR